MLTIGASTILLLGVLGAAPPRHTVVVNISNVSRDQQITAPVLINLCPLLYTIPWRDYSSFYVICIYAPLDLPSPSPPGRQRLYKVDIIVNAVPLIYALHLTCRTRKSNLSCILKASGWTS